jgi:phage repressor protein C with HTH and peptisase S24 domain
VSETPVRDQVLDLLGSTDVALGPTEIAEAVGSTPDSIRQLLGKLKRGGDVARLGRGLYVTHNHPLALEAREEPQPSPEEGGNVSLSNRVVTLEVRRFDNARASAGHGTEHHGDEADARPGLYYIDRIEVEDLVGKGTAPTRPFVVPVDGDSMYPELLPGESVVIEPRETITTDGIHLFRVGEQIFLKRIQRLPDGTFEASSANEVYRPFTIGPDEADDFRVLGKLWGKFKRY